MVPTVCQRMGARSGKTSRFLLSSISAISRCVSVVGVGYGWVGPMGGVVGRHATCNTT